MARKQKRVYVDEVQWSAIKAETGLSTDSDVMDHVMGIYELADALKEIHPNIRAAIGKALAHNDLLKNTIISAQVQVVIDGSSVANIPEKEGVSEPETTISSEPCSEDSNEEW